MSLSTRIFAQYAGPVLRRYVSDTIIWCPDGNRDNPIPILAIVTIDNELGTNELPGDGAKTSDSHGDRERRSAHLELPKFYLVDNVQTPLVVTAKEDIWLFDNLTWTTQRRTGTDLGDCGAYQGWLVTAVLPIRTQHSNVREDRPVGRR